MTRPESGWTQREHRTGHGADASYHEGELERVRAVREGEHRMITVIGVRFRTAGKIYYFDPAGRQIKTGDHVIVETARGIEYGYVVLGNREVE